jgi:gluconate 5-dehydrogenase
MALLDGTRVLVTGGTSGLGRAMAEALLGAGASVAVTGRERTRAEECATSLGARAAGIAMVVRDEDAVAAGVEEAWAKLGGIDMLINNAGIGMRTVNPRFLTDPQPFWEVSTRGFRDVIETKLTGSFLVARAVVPLMLSAGAGRIVCISMNESTMTRRGFVPYGPSGAGVEALARVMAADLEGSPVKVNILLPGGATATGMIPDDMASATRSGLLDPSVMGPPITWLASPQAAGTHNQRIIATEFHAWLEAR